MGRQKGLFASVSAGRIILIFIANMLDKRVAKQKHQQQNSLEGNRSIEPVTPPLVRPQVKDSSQQHGADNELRLMKGKQIKGRLQEGRGNEIVRTFRPEDTRGQRQHEIAGREK